MSGKTGIQWTDETRNVATGCDRVKKANGQSGCDNCYAFAWHDRIYAQHIKGQRPTAPKQYHVPFSASYKRPGTDQPQGVQLLPERLNELLHLRTPRKVFLGSMTDMFHASIPDEYLVDVFGVLAATPHITYQILTKRPQRMQQFITSVDQTAIKVAAMHRLQALPPRIRSRHFPKLAKVWQWPLPNVWLGTSVEDQEAADERIPLLLETPAAVRFLSCEPLLGPVDITGCGGPHEYLYPKWIKREHGTVLDGWTERLLHWVIVGGESGPRARPMDLAWAENLIEQCQTAGVAPFVKQLGTHWAKDRDTRLQLKGKAKTNPHGGTMDEWPEDLRIREFPTGVEVAQ